MSAPIQSLKAVLLHNALLSQGFEEVICTDREAIFYYYEKYTFKDTDECAWLWQ